MTHFLLRCFLKNKADSNTPDSRAAIGSFAGIVGICCNAILFLGKLLAGLITGSIAMIADAFNNLSDAASSVITLLGFHLARRPADKDHPYGHARYEYLTALAVALLILMLGFELAKSSVSKILHPQAMTISPAAIAVLAAAIAVKLWMARFYRTLGQMIHSQALEASALDSRSDVVATSGVLVGCLLDRIGGWSADGIIGLAVAGCILWSGFCSLRDTLSPLLGGQPDESLVEQIEKLVLSREQVLGAHDLLVHDYGPGQCFASIHAEVSSEVDPLHCHDLLERIEQDALQQLNVHLVIHCDPIATNDPEWDRIRALTCDAIAEVDPRLSIHDFHLVEHDGLAHPVFDLTVPYDFPVSREELEIQLQNALKEKGICAPAVIIFDSAT